MAQPVHQAGVYSDDTTLNGRQLFFAASAAGGFFTDGYALLILSIALLGILPELHLRPIEVGFLVSAAFAGMVLGAAISGPLADRYGRKPLFLADMLLFIIASGLFLFVSEFWELIVLRFLIGVAIGADMPASSAMITEISPRARRGTMNSLGSIFWTIGSVFGGLVALAVFAGGSFAYWRWVLASGMIPAGLLLFLRWEMPETPRWLAAVGRHEEAIRASATLGIGGGSSSSIEFAQARAGGRSWRLLVSNPGFLRSLIFVTLYWFLNNGYGAAVLLYQPTAMQSLHVSGLYTPILLTLATAVIAIIVGILTCFYLIESVGRRIVGIVGTLLVGICFFVLGTPIESVEVKVLVYCVSIIAINGVTSATFFAWAPELFPTAVRGTALGRVNAFGKAGAIFGTFVMPIVLSYIGRPTFTILGVLAVLNVLQTGFLAPETAGPSLDELEWGDGDVVSEQVLPK